MSIEAPQIHLTERHVGRSESLAVSYCYSAVEPYEVTEKQVMENLDLLDQAETVERQKRLLQQTIASIVFSGGEVVEVESPNSRTFGVILPNNIRAVFDVRGRGTALLYLLEIGHPLISQTYYATGEQAQAFGVTRSFYRGKSIDQVIEEGKAKVVDYRSLCVVNKHFRASLKQRSYVPRRKPKQ